MIFGIIIIILFVILLWLVFKCFWAIKKIYWLIIKKYIIQYGLSRIKKEHNKKGEPVKHSYVRETIRELLKQNKIEVTDKELDFLIETVLYN